MYTSDSKLLNFEILDCSNLFFQIPGLPGGLEFAKKPTMIDNFNPIENNLLPHPLPNTRKKSLILSGLQIKNTIIN